MIKARRVTAALAGSVGTAAEAIAWLDDPARAV